MPESKSDETHKSRTGKFPFGQVFYDELLFIERRRQQLKDEGLVPADKENDAANVTSADISQLAQLQGKALDKNLCGLAISGGGIRSATFALGVMQGLASLKLLPRFDYLSTVSGGGYIGAWFSTWVNRDGFKEVVTKKLMPPSLQETPQTSAGGSFEVESDTIRHLRLYSNYLAPHPGLFSFDGWALIAIYVRNLLLNQLILLFAVMGLFAAVRGIIELFSIFHDATIAPMFSVPLSLIAVACLIGGVCGIALFAPGNQCGLHFLKRTGRAINLLNSKSYVLCFWLCCVVPWVLAAMFASLLFSNPLAWTWLDGVHFERNCAIGSVVIGVTHALLGCLATSQPSVGLVRGFVAGLIGGVTFFIAWSLLLTYAKASDPDGIPVAVIATFGVPMCLAEFVLINFLVIGLCGSSLQELEREWWSSLNSRFMIVGAGWLALFGIAIFSPWVLGKLWLLYPVGVSAAGVSWFGLLATGIKFAQGPSTGTANQSNLKELVASLAVPLFLITLSLLTTWIYYDVYASLNGNPDWTFRQRLPEMLTDLNSVKSGVLNLPAVLVLFISAGVLLCTSLVVGHYVGVNTFSLQNLYANRLVRCYLGASQHDRHPNRLVNFANKDDIPFSAIYPGMEFQEQQLPKIPRDAAMAPSLSNPTSSDRFRAKQQSFKETRDQECEGPQFHGPLHLINGALNQKASTIHNSRSEKIGRKKTDDETHAEGLQFLERQAESFVFSPLYCGSEATGYCPAFEFANDIKLGTAVSVSGAAVSPNMGYHSSPSITALLTVFNVRLGAWFGNPGRESRKDANPAASATLLLSELAGMTSSDTDYVYVSDGGHFENMGVYELIRRRCRFILAIDAGADPKFHENVGRVVRQVRIDFGISIEVDITPASPDTNGRCQSHMIVGRIRYDDVHKSPTTTADPNDDDPAFHYEQNQGIIIWMKNALTGDEPGDLINYAAMNPNFPYDSTLNQFFNESQFESYRALGLHSTLKSLSVAKPLIDRSASTREVFSSIHDFWLKRPPNVVPIYAAQNDAYANIQKQLRQEKSLSMLAQEVYGTSEQRRMSRAVMADSSSEERLAERLMANEMFTALENVWLTLDLDRQSKQPILEGWMAVFRNWTSSKRLQRCWDADGTTSGISDEFSPAFVRFITSLRKNTPPRPVDAD